MTLLAEKQTNSFLVLPLVWIFESEISIFYLLYNNVSGRIPSHSLSCKMFVWSESHKSDRWNVQTTTPWGSSSYMDLCQKEMEKVGSLFILLISDGQ